jgi:exodeoxyribonuclease VII large subunit
MRLVEEGRQRLDDKGQRLAVGLDNWVMARRSQIDGLRARLTGSQKAMLRAIDQCRDRNGELAHRAYAAALRAMEDQKRHLSSVAKLMESFSYERVLERGFVLVHDTDGAAVTSAGAAREAGSVALRFRDGEVGARVESDAARPSKAKAKPMPAAKTQGRLL